MPKLSALSVKNAKPGRHADGEGLYLLVKPSGAKSWLLRIQCDGKRRDIGLGSVDSSPKAAGQGDTSPIEIPILQRRVLTLGQAREKAALLRTAAKSGLGPQRCVRDGAAVLQKSAAPSSTPQSSRVRQTKWYSNTMSQ